MSESLEQSIKKYSEELAKNPKSRAFVPLADAYRASGRTDEAIEVAKQGVSHYPHYVGGKMALARAYFEHGESEVARELLESVLHTAPDNLLANRILVDIYQEMGEGTKAIPLLKRLLAMEPNDTRAAKQLADIETLATPTDELPPPADLPPVEAKPQPPIAQEVDSDEDEAQSSEPEQPQVEVRTATMAQMYRAQGHLDEALTVYRELAQKEPSNPKYGVAVQEILAEIEAKRVTTPTSSPAESKVARLQGLLKIVQERRRPL